ncbi:MAG: hypothetical protein E7Z91_06140 [Cyanobacteria bacterium SIG30]|nr:hypothetical protein [Cyanobacteria bacterium SIG30]
MGKSKKRILHKTNSSLFMTRESALYKVKGCLNSINSDIKQKNEAKSLITLFGLSAEELSEAGVGYEYLKSLDSLICI